VLDAADINRIVTNLNRTQILNSRAALATACAGLLAAARIWLDLLGRL
jgi:DNA-binding MurR/RpiR family transcriptional regulator